MDVSVKATDNGPVPVCGFAVKLVTGADTAWVTVMNPVLIASLLPPALVAVRLISYVPAGNINVGFAVVANWVQPTVAFLYAHFHEVGVFVEVSVN